LKSLKKLTTLELSSTLVTGAGLNELNNLTALNNLSSTHVTDAGMKELSRGRLTASCSLIAPLPS
jgi:hypothetical protein